MATRAGLNKNSSAVKRIMSEARELREDDSTEYSAGPLEEDIFEWHCTIRGPADTEFEGGLYHCRISLPPEYPFKAPSIMVLTPNGRFELNKKICISFTSYHEELWQPAWGVRTAIIGLQGFFPLKGEAAVGVGAIECPIAERKRLAALSRSWVCPDCGVPNIELLPDPPAKEMQTLGQTLGQAPRSAYPMANPIVPEPTSPVQAGGEPPSVTEPQPDTPSLPRDPSLNPPHEVSNNPVTPTPTVTQTSPVTATPQPVPTPVRVDTQTNARNSPPLWLDASIAFISIVIAYMMGKRLLWDFASEDFGPA